MKNKLFLHLILNLCLFFIISSTISIGLEDINNDESEIIIFDNDGIIITEPNKTIDLNRVTLRGKINESGTLISIIKTDNITIKNGIFTGNVEVAIEVIESTNVTLYNNSFINIKKPKDAEYGGYCILVDSGNSIDIIRNFLDDNEIGIFVRGKGGVYVNDVTVSGNIVKNTWMSSAIKCNKCSNVTIKNNYLDNNGKPEFFEKQRIVGIDLHETHDSKVFNNTVIKSSSDGIGVPGEVWEENTIYSYNIEISNNTIIDNGEQGIWAIAGRNITIHSNNITSTCHCYTGCSGIFFEWDVSNSKIFKNKVTGRGNNHTGITLKNSQSNIINNNTIQNIRFGIIIESTEGFQVIGDDDGILKFVRPMNNLIIDNKIDTWEDCIILEDENNLVKNNICISKLDNNDKNQDYPIPGFDFIIVIVICISLLILRKEFFVF